MKLNTKLSLLVIMGVVLPMTVFYLIFVSNIELSAFKEMEDAMEYQLESATLNIRQKVDAINVSSQFVLSDLSLYEYLQDSYYNRERSYEEMIEFYDVNVASMERMVNSNPYLYQIRVFADKIDEMMPILYTTERMERLEWAEGGVTEGWKFSYVDTIFESFQINQEQVLLSLVTPIENNEGMEIGVLEVAMKMETMFPELYQSQENFYACFIDENEKIYTNDYHRVRIGDYLELLSDNREQIEGENNTFFLEESENQQMILGGVQYIQELNGTLIYFENLSPTIATLNRERYLFLVGIILGVLLIIIIIDYVVRKVLSQFYQVLAAIRQVGKGNLELEIPTDGKGEMGELSLQINDMVTQIQALMQDNFQRELLMKDSEIRALQNQINAHFLYNVLETIKMMAEIEEEYVISDSITSLGNLLRYSMKWSSPKVTVKEELGYIQDYLALLNLRYDYEIYLSLNIPEKFYSQLVPKMSLQPIIENAICHGIEEIAEDTSIYIKIYEEESQCLIEITDAGKGMSQETLELLYQKLSGEIEETGNRGNGIGLRNVQDRIKMEFGDVYGLEIASQEGAYTKVKVVLPLTE